MNRQFKINLFLIFAGSIIVIGLLHNVGGSPPAQRTPSAGVARTPAAQAAQHAPPLEAPISDIPWSRVDAIYNLSSKETDLSKDEKWKDFKGKRVRWTGAVTAVSEPLGVLTLQVKMDPDTVTSDLIIDLPETQRANALLLKETDTVTFTGTLDSWGTILPIALTDGKIEKAERSAPKPISSEAQANNAPPPFDWDHAPRSESSIILYLQSPHPPDFRPQVGTIYYAGDLFPIQKVDSGYLVTRWDPFGDEGSSDMAFLETDQDFPSNHPIQVREARYVGLYQYAGLDGFEHTVEHFQTRPISP